MRATQARGGKWAQTVALFRGLAASLAVLLLATCGQEVVDYDALYVVIRSEAPDGGPITRLDIGAIGFGAEDATLFRLPEQAGDADFQVALPASVDLVNKSYRLRIFTGTQPVTRLQLRVRGLNDSLAVLTGYSGVVDTPGKAREITITLKRPDLGCDADQDGVKNCAIDGCCAPQDASDCDDTSAAASPFDHEDPCTQCGNNIDEDCDGVDLACVDGDTDGVPDCQELSCGPGAGTDPTIHPGAPELCDGKDNDCDGATDESLTYVGIDGIAGSLAKGASCGTGACTGGTVVCDAEGKGLVCSSADKKVAAENCDNQIDDDCNGKVNDGCALTDIDGDGVPNDVEDKACKHPYARFHSEIFPGNTSPEPCCLAFTAKILAVDAGWSDGDPVPSAAAASNAELAVCDFNCDGAIKACAPKDTDGDGVPAPLDCDDKDPLTYPNAPEKCGDGKVQACVGADPGCDSATDKDGDGWMAPADCNDDVAAIHPGATELCNGVDDDCDGMVDDGNAEAADVPCGDKDGECGKIPGITVCKHWPTGQEPGPLDCLAKAYDKSSLTCVGCEGDGRPSEDVCDYLDNDCDGTSDEDYTYQEQGTGAKLAVGATCDGIGACGVGKVECRISKDKAICSTDAEGSKSETKPEICDDKDNNCNGTTDESLTSIADSTCHKAGVCSASAVAQILTVCVAGKWVCDYTKVAGVEFDTKGTCQPGDAFCHCPGLGDGGKKCFPMVESTCEGKDNDCDGKTDDDFEFDDLGTKRKVGDVCGTGACASGKTVCKVDTSGLTCDSLPKITKEVCDAKDNDCNGKTDDGMTVVDSSCSLVGQCNAQNVIGTCEGGKWVCKYDNVPAYQALKEADCDGKDNDCDGKTDEDFLFDDLGAVRTIGQACGTGVCASGNVVCTADKKAMTCSTLVKISTDICDTLDNDCDGKTDENFKYFGVAMGAVCDGVGACGSGVAECTPGKTDAATCSTNPEGSKSESTLEICNDADDDCDGVTDEGCDDDTDDFCDADIKTVDKPKVCPNGGGDCNDDDLAYNPKVVELCDGKDQDCDSKTDETFTWSEVNAATGKTAVLGVGAPCGLGVCSGGLVTCADLASVTCTTIGKKGTEICDDLDNDCDGLTDEGCNDDNDDYCDKAMTTQGTPSVCLKGGGDCDDLVKTTFPTAVEVCNDVDDDCNGTTDDACDKDGDGWCDAAKTTVNKPKICPNGGGDCNDVAGQGATLNPASTEVCNDLDDNCVGGADEGCDDDSDGYCDIDMTVVGKPKSCSKGGGDCNDKVGSVYPSATEACNDVDDNCDKSTDEGCDDDNDGWCDDSMVTVNKPKACPNGGGDCEDTAKNGPNIHPTAPEMCNGKDDDCNGKTDAADATNLLKTAPDCENQKGVCKGLKKVATLCAGGTWKACPDSLYTSDAPNYESTNEATCDNLDNDCDANTDEGCDDDGDDYCDDSMTTKGKPLVCPNGGGDCDDKADAKGPKIHPGVTETCLTTYDDDCNGEPNDLDAVACSDFYYDSDKDGWGSNAKPKLCLCSSQGAFTATKVGDCNDNSKDASTFSWDAPDGKTIELGGACGTGACKGGSVICSGATATCSTGTKTATEVCNGVDDDCDGKTDGDDSSLDLSGATCTGKGVCASATPVKSCVAAKLVCDYSGATDYQATESKCDNKDNDCDGQTDESIDFGSFKCLSVGVCFGQDVTPQCKSGVPTCDYSKIATYQSTEDTCDGKDNDCDGQTDESPNLSSLTCKSKGLCSGKTIPKVCTAGAPTCDYSAVSGYEADESSCNNKDDDCDGQTDEVADVLKSDCKLTGVCNGSNVSAMCAAGNWVCNYTSVSGYEAIETTVNDSKDNDCDGQTDEGP